MYFKRFVSPLSGRPPPAGVELYKQEISQALEQAGAPPEEAAAALDPALLVPLEVLDSLEAGQGPVPRAPGSGRVGEGSTTAGKGSRFTGLSWSEKLGRWEVREVLCLPACMHAVSRSSVRSRCCVFCIVLACQLWANSLVPSLLHSGTHPASIRAATSCAASSDGGAGKPLPGRSAGLLTCSVCACAAAVVLSLLASSLPQVRAWYQNKQHFVGSFESEEAAARAYDRQILKLAGPTAHMQNARWVGALERRRRGGTGVFWLGLIAQHDMLECMCQVFLCQAWVQLRFKLIRLSDPHPPQHTQTQTKSNQFSLCPCSCNNLCCADIWLYVCALPCFCLSCRKRASSFQAELPTD